MKYEFAAFYNGKLRQCHIDTQTNTVIIPEESVVRSLTDIPGRNLPFLRVYMWIGQLDANGNKLYEGSLVFAEGILFEVAWNEKLAGFGLKYIDGELKNTWATAAYGWDELQIFAHVGGIEE